MEGNEKNKKQISQEFWGARHRQTESFFRELCRQNRMTFAVLPVRRLGQ